MEQCSIFVRTALVYFFRLNTFQRYRAEVFFIFLPALLVATAYLELLWLRSQSVAWPMYVVTFSFRILPVLWLWRVMEVHQLPFKRFSEDFSALLPIVTKLKEESTSFPANHKPLGENSDLLLYLTLIFRKRLFYTRMTSAYTCEVVSCKTDVVIFSAKLQITDEDVLVVETKKAVARNL